VGQQADHGNASLLLDHQSRLAVSSEITSLQGFCLPLSHRELLLPQPSLCTRSQPLADPSLTESYCCSHLLHVHGRNLWYIPLKQRAAVTPAFSVCTVTTSSRTHFFPLAIPGASHSSHQGCAAVGYTGSCKAHKPHHTTPTDFSRLFAGTGT